MSLRIGSYRDRRPAAVVRGLAWTSVIETDTTEPSLTVDAHVSEKKKSPSAPDPPRTTHRSYFDEDGPSAPPRARMFAPLNSPLENLVPYSAFTTLISPRVSTHLNPKLASFPESWDSEEAEVEDGDSKRSSTSSSGNVIGTSKMDFRLSTSTDLEISNFLLDQRYLQSIHATKTNIKHAKQEVEQRKASMLVLDVFVTENRTLQAYGIGTSPDKPLYIYYPLRHPYDEAFLETIGNRNTVSYDFPPISDDLLNLDGKESKRLAKLKTPFGPPLKRRSTSVSNPVLTLPLCQSLLQFYNPLEGYRPETVSGLRWSSVWVNSRFRACLHKPEETRVASILPTEEELNAMAAREIEIACYRARQTKVNRFQRWISKIVHEKWLLRDIKVTGGLTEDERRQLAQPDVLRKTEDAGAIFFSPDVTVPSDPRVAKFIIPALFESAKARRTAVPLSSRSIKSPRNSTGSEKRSGDDNSRKEQGTTAKTKEEQGADIGFPKKHPITHRVPDSLSFSRRPATIYDLHQLAEEKDVNFTPGMTIEPKFPTEFVFADEYASIGSDGKSDTYSTMNAGIQIYYEPPVAKTKEERKQSDVSYVSGKYMWVHESTSWVVVYERHTVPTSWQKAEKEKKKTATLAKAKSMPNLKQKEKETEMMQVAKTVARVKLYPPATSGRDMLAYLDFETGQLSIRRDIALENLHLVVLAMFSVVNIEEAIYKEKVMQKKLQLRKNIAALLCLPATEGQEKIPSEVEGNSDKRSSTSSVVNGQFRDEVQPSEIEQEEEEEADSDGEDSVQEMVRRTSSGWVTIRRDHIEENYGKKDTPRVPVRSSSHIEWTIATAEAANLADQDLGGNEFRGDNAQ